MSGFTPLLFAAILAALSIATDVGGQRLQSGSSARFWIEKILSRSFAMAALIMLLQFAINLIR